MRRLHVEIGLVVLLALVGASSPAYAQSAFAGVVNDTTGALLPGVTIEARSPALIEQSRTAVTDNQGQYRLVDLRPGVYSVTFSLAGFGTVSRDGILLEADFTAPLNIEMKVGDLSEEMTVTGVSPVVDVQSTVRREVVSRELVDSLPTARSFSLIGATLPAVNLGGVGGIGSAFDVAGSTSMAQGTLNAYGGTGVQSTLMDGMRLDGPFAQGQILNYLNEGATEQYIYQVNGGMAESQLGVVVVNMVPRSGGNRFSGNGVALQSMPSLQANNISPEYEAQGFKTAPTVKSLYDYNIGIGGPIRQDRAWFYGSYRDWKVDNYTNQVNDELAVLGPPGSKIVDENEHAAMTGRITVQAGRKNRIGLMYEKGHFERAAIGVATNLTRPEAANYYLHTTWPGEYYAIAKLTSTLSNRLLVEGGTSWNVKSWLNEVQPNYALAHTAPARLDVISGIANGNVGRTFFHPLFRDFVSGSVTYVTGSHLMKAGFQGSHGTDTIYNDTPTGATLLQQYRNGVPFGVVVYDYPNSGTNYINEYGFFVQDSWTFKGLTLNPGMRWDKFIGSIPAASQPATRFFPAHNTPAQDDVPNWDDVSLRFGTSYALGGDKMVVKFSAGKFLQTFASGFVQQYNPMQSSNALVGDPRTWTDANKDDIAQNNEIGPTRNPNFGLSLTRTPDPDLERPYDMLYNVSFERELTRGVALVVAYNRRDAKNLIYAQNLANPISDWQMLRVANPMASGETVPVYQVLPAAVRGASQLDVNSTNSRVYNGVDVNFRGRVLGGTMFNLGTSTGRIVANTCEVTNPNSLRFCDESQYPIPYLTIFKASGTYPVKWHNLALSAVYQSIPGSERFVNYTVTNAQLPQLTTASSVSIRLSEPGSIYRDRFNNLDLSASFRFKVKGLNLKPQLDLFNVSNINDVLTETNQYPTQGIPVTIIPPRLLRFGIQVDF